MSTGLRYAWRKEQFLVQAMDVVLLTPSRQSSPPQLLRRYSPQPEPSPRVDNGLSLGRRPIWRALIRHLGCVYWNSGVVKGQSTKDCERQSSCTTSRSRCNEPRKKTGQVIDARSWWKADEGHGLRRRPAHEQ